MLNQQMHGNILPMTAALPKSFPDTNAPSSSVSANTDEETSVPQTSEKIMPMSQLIPLQFAYVIYSCGSFRHKNDRNAQALVSNLSQHNELCSEGKQFLQNKFSNGKILPVFFKKLQKIVEFEAMIGLLPGKSEVMAQLMAPKDCVYFLFHLLLYWLNLKASEKQYGMDVNLPMNTGNMWSFLKSLNLPRFYKDIKNPMWRLSTMEDYKERLHGMPKNSEYYRIQTYVRETQSEFLAFINTHPKPSTHFRKMLAYTEILKCRVMTRQLDAPTYLGILLSYNHICTPHTPPDLRDTLKYITLLKQSSKEQKELMQKELNTNATQSMPLATSFFGALQTNMTANSFAANFHNVTHDTSNVIDIYQPGTSGVAKTHMQYCQNMLLFDAKPMSIESENSKRKHEEWSTGNVNINTNLQMTEPNINLMNTNNQSDDLKYLTATTGLVSGSEERKQIRDEMFQTVIVNQAHGSQLPHNKRQKLY